MGRAIVKPIINFIIGEIITHRTSCIIVFDGFRAALPLSMITH